MRGFKEALEGCTLHHFPVASAHAFLLLVKKGETIKSVVKVCWRFLAYSDTGPLACGVCLAPFCCALLPIAALRRGESGGRTFGSLVYGLDRTQHVQ